MHKLPEELLNRKDKQNIKEFEYIKKIYYLDHYYDESELEKKFPDNFRCKSFI